MLEKHILRALIFEVFKRTPDTQINTILNDIDRLVKQQNLIAPSGSNLSDDDQNQILEICWDLITERIITPGTSKSKDSHWPFLRITSFGSTVLSESQPHYYDPEAYIKYVKSNINGLDIVIEQYMHEGVSCFKRQLFFASAVMFGAAAEKAVLLLLESIANAVSQPQERKEIQELLDRPRLPTIYNKINTVLATLIQNNVIPYNVHQGCNEHLLSLFEMVRVQRNDAIHPVVGNVDKAKVFLSMQSLPTALEVVYRLINWLNAQTKRLVLETINRTKPLI